MAFDHVSQAQNFPPNAVLNKKHPESANLPCT